MSETPHRSRKARTKKYIEDLMIQQPLGSLGLISLMSLDWGTRLNSDTDPYRSTSWATPRWHRVLISLTPLIKCYHLLAGIFLGFSQGFFKIQEFPNAHLSSTSKQLVQRTDLQAPLSDFSSPFVRFSHFSSFKKKTSPPCFKGQKEWAILLL